MISRAAFIFALVVTPAILAQSIAILWSMIQ